MKESAIEWTTSTWNPVRGCSRISTGCENCYAERQAHRFSAMSQPYAGLVKLSRKGEPHWTGEVRKVPHMLSQPLRWKKGRRIFVNSMSDLFHETLSLTDIAAVFGVMATADHHQFQVLTKRAKIMNRFVRAATAGVDPVSMCCDAARHQLQGHGGAPFRKHVAHSIAHQTDWPVPWPLPNVWLGVSVEDQQAAAERIPQLLNTPAAVRWLSVEPLLEKVDLGLDGMSDIDWIVVGGESGPGARPCDVEWIADVVEQALACGIAVFVKQLGANVVRHSVKHRKGADMGEWPEELRIRQYPQDPGGVVDQ